jgi:hypothetical protein
MKLNLLAAAVVGAAIAQVTASPLRVVVVSTSQDISGARNLRFGHALADSPAAKATFNGKIVDVKSAGPFHRRPCGERMKEKALEISNTFRHALGLPLIEAAHVKPGEHVHGGVVQILPFIGGSPKFIESPTPFHGNLEIFPTATDIHQPIYIHHHHGHRQHRWTSTFGMRIHNALMALGPWEGRAVAFVLGCGIGVLLRMIWVLAVVMYRAIRGEQEEPQYTPVAIIEEYVETDGVPPPSYTDVNEKEQVKGCGPNTA